MGSKGSRGGIVSLWLDVSVKLKIADHLACRAYCSRWDKQSTSSDTSDKATEMPTWYIVQIILGALYFRCGLYWVCTVGLQKYRLQQKYTCEH